MSNQKSTEESMTSGITKSISAFDISHIVKNSNLPHSTTESSLFMGFLSAKKTAQQLKRRAVHLTEQARKRREDFRGKSEVCHSAAPSTNTSRISSRCLTSDSYKIRSATAFPIDHVEKIIRHTLTQELDDKTYQQDYCRQISFQLTDRIMDHVKKLHLPRYRLVCYVNIGQKSGQGMALTSQCLWDDNLDNYASYYFQNSSLYAVGVVYAVYCE